MCVRSPCCSRHVFPFNVYDDIPKVLYDLRKGQLKKLHEARDKGYTAFFSKAHPDKCLSMEDILHPVNQCKSILYNFLVLSRL